jgi:hypothetical protein
MLKTLRRIPYWAWLTSALLAYFAIGFLSGAYYYQRATQEPGESRGSFESRRTIVTGGFVILWPAQVVSTVCGWAWDGAVWITAPSPKQMPEAR